MLRDSINKLCRMILSSSIEYSISSFKYLLHNIYMHEFAFNILQQESSTSNPPDGLVQLSSGWDCSLHLPLWVSETEKAMIEKRLEGWTKELEASGADIASMALSLRKPLRPLWISQKTVIWLNEVPEYDSWDFTPIILVSASSQDSTFQHRTTSEFSWKYIAGAGDDEESWARGLSPHLFWKHAHDIISSGPDLCNQKVASIVEKDRVGRAQRGENAGQVSVNPSKRLGSISKVPIGEPLVLDDGFAAEGEKISDDHHISFLGSTNIAVGKSQLGMNFFVVCGKMIQVLSLHFQYQKWGKPWFAQFGLY